MVLALSKAAQQALSLGILAAVALATWLVLLGVLALVTRPDLPDAMPASSAFGGEERPAVAGFLVNRWEVGREAVPATLLDLAAKGVVAIDQVAPDRFVCRLLGASGGDRPGQGGNLVDYERLVLDHVRGLASDGVVPCEALTTGPQDDSERWWKRFEKAVVADARGQGLSRSRWSKPLLTVLGIGAAVPALLAAAALVRAPTEDRSNSSGRKKDDGPGAVVALAVVGWGALMSLPLSLRAERDTPAGRAAAARWLGLRDYLHEDEAFDQAPPAAVAIWDRYLSYGAAMGVAAGAVRALPLGAESDYEAWSAYGGKWHVVRVRYPVRIPPGWGTHPFKVAGKGLLVLAGAAAILKVFGPPAVDAVRDQPVAQLVALGVLAVMAVVVLRAAVMLVFGAGDLFRRDERQGLVVRMRSGYVAVDEGTQRVVRAWRLDSTKGLVAVRGTIVKVTVTPRLGYVSRIDVADRARPDAVLS